MAEPDFEEYHAEIDLHPDQLTIIVTEVTEVCTDRDVD